MSFTRLKILFVNNNVCMIVSPFFLINCMSVLFYSLD